MGLLLRYYNSMPKPLKLSEEYMAKLRQRAKESHVYRKYQLLGLEIAQALGDEKHKALYIKLAKERNGETLLRLAKDIAERRNVKNKGAYFMRIISGEKKENEVSGRAQKPELYGGKNLFAPRRKSRASGKS